MKTITIEMSDRKRLIILTLMFLLMIGLMVFEIIRTEEYKKSVVDLCIHNENRICRCGGDLSFNDGLLQVIE
jgi:hypothetical protein